MGILRNRTENDSAGDCVRLGESIREQDANKTVEVGPKPALTHHLGWTWADTLILYMLAGLAVFASLYRARHAHSVIVSSDTWFDADLIRVIQNMRWRTVSHARTSVHPLFSLLGYPLVKFHCLAFGINAITSAMVVIAEVAAAWVSVFFFLLRLLGCHRFDATLFSLLAASSASAVFWFAVPETYAFGSLSILVALVIVALAPHREPSELWYVIAGVATLSVTITNWMVGIFAAFVQFPWRRALQITVNAFCLVVVLWVVEKRVFPSAVFFLGYHDSEDRFILPPESGGSLSILNSFLFHTMVMPAIAEVENPLYPDRPNLSIQRSLPGSGSIWGRVAVGLWATLLVLGLWGLFTIGRHLQLRVVLTLTILGQLALHLLYGKETFLYSCHFGPLLVVLAALSTLTRARQVALAVAVLLVACGGINNGLQFDQAVQRFERLQTSPQTIQSTILHRPNGSGDPTIQERSCSPLKALRAQ